MRRSTEVHLVDGRRAAPGAPTDEGARDRGINERKRRSLVTAIGGDTTHVNDETGAYHEAVTVGQAAAACVDTRAGAGGLTTPPSQSTGRRVVRTSQRNAEPAQERQLSERGEQTNEGQSVFCVSVHESM